MAMKKYRVYMHIDARISTEVLAPDREAAQRQVDALPLEGCLSSMCDREWETWELSGGVYKTRELVEHTREVEA